MFFVVVKGHVGRAKPLLRRTAFEHSGGSAGASPSQECGYRPRIRCRLPRGIAPLTPGPSPPFRGRGEDFVFFVVAKGRVGRAKLLLSRTAFEHSGGSAAASPSHGCGYRPRIRCRLLMGTCPPHPRPLSPVSRGRGEDFVFFVVAKGHAGRAKLLLSRTRLTECPAAAE